MGFLETEWEVITTSCRHEGCEKPIVTDPDQFSGYYRTAKLCAEHLRIANQCYLEGCCNPSIRTGWLYSEEEYMNSMYLCEKHLVQECCTVLSPGKYRCANWVENCHKEVSVGCVLYCQDCFFEQSCVECGQSLKTYHPPSYSPEERGYPQTCDKYSCKKRHDRDAKYRKYGKEQEGPTSKKSRLDVETLGISMLTLGLLDN